MSKKILFEFEEVASMEVLRNLIQGCEGKHQQQVCYSTFHDRLTQICFTERKIRINKKEALKC